MIVVNVLFMICCIKEIVICSQGLLVVVVLWLDVGFDVYVSEDWIEGVCVFFEKCKLVFKGC